VGKRATKEHIEDDEGDALQDEQISKMNRLARERAGSAVDDVPPGDDDDDAGDGRPDNVPWIELPRVGHPLEKFAREAANVCSKNGVYRRDMEIVTVNSKHGGIEGMDPQDFRTYLEGLAVTFKWVSKGKNEPAEEEPTTMSTEVAKGTLRSRQFIYRQRELLRVHSIRQPIMREDGRIELLPEGYDAHSKIMTRESPVQIYQERCECDDCKKNGWRVRAIPLAGATAVLRTLLKDFPFVSPLDLAVQIASMLSFYGALLLPINAERMNFACKANKHRSGKTLLIKISIAPVMGEVLVEAFPPDSKELKELLNSTANDGASYLVLDDIMGHVKSPALNAFITASLWGFRGYHTQRKIKVPRQCVVYLSGHEMSLAADLEGRFLECRLHVEEADSQAHRVPNPINERWLSQVANRSDICNALYSIIAHWDAAGRPRGKNVKPGFEEWCEVFGGIVTFAGFEDPCQLRPDGERTDDEYDDMAALVKALLGQFAEGERLKEFTFGELIEQCVELNLLTWKIDGKWKTEKHGEGGPTERWYETTKKSEGAMAWLLNNKYGGTVFRIDGKKVRFGKTGKNRSRKYTLSIEEG